MKQTDLLKNLIKTDLNLLTVLHALLEYGSTQGAANHIGRTQSAVSHALGRLRLLFDDPLFVRNGPKLTPTKLALQMRQPLQRVLHDVTSLIESGMQFDPATSDRQIVIGTSDIVLSIAMAITDALKSDAPRLKIRLAENRHGTTRLLNGQIDLLITMYRDEVPSGLELTPITNLDWSLFARKDHPISDRPSAQEWARHDHVQVYTGSGRNPINDAATLIGVERQVGMQVSNFLQALHVVRRSNLLFATMSDLARPLAKTMGLKEITLPLAVPPVPLGLVTRATKHDPLSNWISRHAIAVTRQMLT